MRADLLIYNIGQLVTLAGPPGPRRGAAMRELAITTDGAAAVADGRVLAVGRSANLTGRIRSRRKLDAGGRAAVPGFVDPHTHLPWAGDRAAEFEMRIGGATYMQIMAAGGGIVRTVGETRQRVAAGAGGADARPAGSDAGARDDHRRGKDRLRPERRR